MGYDRTALKRPVNITLNEDHVRQARGLTSNLSETVESLLARFVEDSEARAVEQREHRRRHVVRLVAR